DTFVMVSHAGNDVITDFTVGDVIDVSAFFSNLAGVQAAASQSGANTVIQLGGGSLTLDNTTVGSLQASEFSFTPLTAPTGGGGGTAAPTTVTGTAANNYTVTVQGVVRQYSVGANGSTLQGGPDHLNDALSGIHRIDFVDGYLAYSPTDTAGQVYRLYEATLARAPDQAGLTNWTNQLNAGASLQGVAGGFVGSQEFQNVYGNLSNTDFVTLLYNNVLHR